MQPIEKIKSSLPDTDEDVVRLFSYAKVKILAEGIPFQLKATSYLRLCCIAIQHLKHQVGDFEKTSQQLTYDKNYSDLLHSLCKVQESWWKSCWVSDRGILRSSNPAIDKLLEPLGFFIELFAYQYPSQNYTVLAMNFKETCMPHKFLRAMVS